MSDALHRSYIHRSYCLCSFVLAFAWTLASLCWAQSPAIPASPDPQDPALTEAEETHFETKVRPILVDNCIECHGANKASGGLRLDSHAALLKGGDSGPAIKPGNPDDSLLVQAICHRPDSELKMPPERALSAQAVEDLRQWVAAGAKWPASLSVPLDSSRRHWAFEPLLAATPPEDSSGWAEQPIDRFIAQARIAHNLQPVGQAEKSTLIRRAYFDLVGLPPAPETVREYLANDSPEAFASVVDQLLGSQRYGERWGRYWLDLVRYADTAGDNADYPIPQAYLYRDYVIDAFNNDLPYDRFLHEQIAGDLLAREAPESDYARLVIATGFIAQSKRIGTRELEDMHLIIEDTLTTLGPVMLGLSLRCARCHDHKYEPLSMQDYYGLYGFFASTQYPFAGAEEVRKQTNFAPLALPKEVSRLKAEHAAKLAELKSQIEQLEKQVASTQAPLSESSTPEPAVTDDKKASLNKLREELMTLEKTDPLSGVPTAYAVGELQPTDVPIQPAGNPRAKSDQVARRGVPKVLDKEPLPIPDGVSGRLELANWMTTRASHLTARVMVNRVWQYHFGKPLVATPSDFGLRGSRPTHPELLDYLATEFIASGWSLKALHRQIMLSKSYQLSSTHDEANMQADASNAWYWRFDRRRMDAESLRDSLLSLAGTLELTRPGPHPFPEPAKWRYTAHHQFNDVCYPSNHRSVYLMVQRLHAHPYLSLFNGADASLSTPRRDESTVPLQALYLLNSPFLHEQAALFGRKAMAQPVDVRERVTQMIWQVYSRAPRAEELEHCSKFIQQMDQTLATENPNSTDQASESWIALARILLASNEFYFVD